jgi:hypothetical protein
MAVEVLSELARDPAVPILPIPLGLFDGVTQFASCWAPASGYASTTSSVFLPGCT